MDPPQLPPCERVSPEDDIPQLHGGHMPLHCWNALVGMGAKRLFLAGFNAEYGFPTHGEPNFEQFDGAITARHPSTLPSISSTHTSCCLHAGTLPSTPSHTTGCCFNAEERQVCRFNARFNAEK